jgi:hypothetical protein
MAYICLVITIGLPVDITDIDIGIDMALSSLIETKKGPDQSVKKWPRYDGSKLQYLILQINGILP